MSIQVDFFKFKQFSINQHGTTLKITTDASIQAAWAAVTEAKQILDIGTGSGLLALMLAQKSDALITAIEPDQQAATLAQQNFKNSPWSKHLRVLNESLQSFQNKNSPHSFDYIICNPPFFKNHLIRQNQRLNQAMHSDSLKLEELALGIAKLMAENGTANVMLPAYESGLLQTEMKKANLYPKVMLLLSHTIDSPIIRHITLYQFGKSSLKTDTLHIRKRDGSYSDAYRQLLKDYLIIF